MIVPLVQGADLCSKRRKEGGRQGGRPHRSPSRAGGFSATHYESTRQEKTGRQAGRLPVTSVPELEMRFSENGCTRVTLGASSFSSEDAVSSLLLAGSKNIYVAIVHA